MSSAPAASEIVRDAGWLAQALDPASGMLRIVQMDREAYRAASFLDDRMLQEPHFAGVVPWDSVAEAIPPGARRDARWIFHIGHVGSTLVSRLLGELPGVLAVREPRILRDIAAVTAEQRANFTGPATKLLSRTLAPDETALVKATSFVSEVAPELVPPGERALFLYATPRNYIASILAGENSVKELAMLAPSRTQRIGGRAQLPESNSGADLAVAAWACEITALEAASEAMTDRQVAWADFDALLDDVAGELGRIAGFFSFKAEPELFEAIATGPLMQRYSKALEFDYSPALRRDLIAEAETANRADIDSALAMLQSAAATSPLLARALERANSES
jgi:hypothetical protein